MDVEADDWALFSEFDRERQADVAQANYGDGSVWIAEVHVG